MNAKIKEILDKHNIPNYYFSEPLLYVINNSIIEICEAQKEECTSFLNGRSVLHKHLKTEISNTKNIAL